MVSHVRHHTHTSDKKDRKDSLRYGASKPAEAMLDGFQRVEAITALVESAIVWRANLLASACDMEKAEELLFRLIFKEGSKNPTAMDLLARIWFQMGKTSQSLDLFKQAAVLQPGNRELKRAAELAQKAMNSKESALLPHRLKMLAAVALFFVVISGLGYGFSYTKNYINTWVYRTSDTTLSGRFVFDGGSMTYEYFGDFGDKWQQGVIADIPQNTTEVDEHKKYQMKFNRKNGTTGAALGRVEVVVEQRGGNIRVMGVVPSLYVRFMVEEAMWNIPGAENVDLRELEVERTYSVAKGENLWLISKKVFGDGQAWTVLSKYNDLKDPQKLAIGDKLKIPLGNETLEQER